MFVQIRKAMMISLNLMEARMKNSLWRKSAKLKRRKSRRMRRSNSLLFPKKIRNHPNHQSLNPRQQVCSLKSYKAVASMCCLSFCEVINLRTTLSLQFPRQWEVLQQLNVHQKDLLRPPRSRHLDPQCLWARQGAEYQSGTHQVQN